MITFVSQSFSVELPNPTFGNTKASSVQLSVRRTLSNIQKTYVTTSVEQKHNLTIPNIIIARKAELDDVLTEAEQLITYTDKDGQDWSGYITNFPFDIVEIFARERDDECIAASEDGGPTERRYSCTINFRGIKI